MGSDHLHGPVSLFPLERPEPQVFGVPGREVHLLVGVAIEEIGVGIAGSQGEEGQDAAKAFVGVDGEGGQAHLKPSIEPPCPG